MTPAEVDAMHPDELDAFARFMSDDFKAQRKAARSNRR